LSQTARAAAKISGGQPVEPGKRTGQPEGTVAPGFGAGADLAGDNDVIAGMVWVSAERSAEGSAGATERTPGSGGPPHFLSEMLYAVGKLPGRKVPNPVIAVSR
jgi:hypothetical protein